MMIQQQCRTLWLTYHLHKVRLHTLYNHHLCFNNHQQLALCRDRYRVSKTQPAVSNSSRDATATGGYYNLHSKYSIQCSASRWRLHGCDRIWTDIISKPKWRVSTECVIQILYIISHTFFTYTVKMCYVIVAIFSFIVDKSTRRPEQWWEATSLSNRWALQRSMSPCLIRMESWETTP